MRSQETAVSAQACTGSCYHRHHTTLAFHSKEWFCEVTWVRGLCGRQFLPWGTALCWPGWFSGFLAHWWSAFHLGRHVLCTACNTSLGRFSQLCQLSALLEPTGWAYRVPAVNHRWAAIARKSVGEGTGKCFLFAFYEAESGFNKDIFI